MQKCIKRYKGRKNVQIFHDISNLLWTFQVSYTCHQVAILVYKTLIKSACIISTLHGNETVIIWGLNIKGNLILTYQGTLKSNRITLTIDVTCLKRIISNKLNQMFSFNCDPSRCIKRLSCNFILKSLVPLA